MGKLASQPVYEQVVKIAHVYLGPAADRFIARQIQNHLHKEPENLTYADLGVLIDWIRVAVSLITEDSEMVQEFTSQLESLVTAKENFTSERYGSR